MLTPQNMRSLGYQQFQSISAVVQLGTTAPAVGNTAVPAGASYAIIAVEGQAIRWRADGTDPTATVGMPVAAGATFSYSGAFERLRMFPQVNGATINVYYFETIV